MGGNNSRRRVVLAVVTLVGLTVSCVSDEVTSPTLTKRLPYAAYAFPRSTHDVAGAVPRHRSMPSHKVTTPASAGRLHVWMPAGRRISPRWTTIVVHHSATARGGARPFDRFHRKKGWDGLGYHFVIGNGTDTPDGYVEVGARWHKQKHGAHCKTPTNYYNEHGIGICLVGDFTETAPSARQIRSLTRLVGFLADRCDIAPERVTTHSAVTRRTECPGHRFRIADLRRSLSALPTASVMP